MLVDYISSSKTCEWATPQKLFDDLNAEFHFTVDVAADDTNHKCERYYTIKDDGLSHSWGGATSMVQSPIWQGDRQVGAESI